MRTGIFVAAMLFVPMRTLGGEAVDRVLQLRAYMDGVSATLAGEQANTLAEIDDPARKDLAMVYYLRAGKSIAARWSWTQGRIDQYERSPEYVDARTEIEKITRRFAADNPGFVLRPNTLIRSLDKQIGRWREVDSIGVASTELVHSAKKELSTGSYPVNPTKQAISRFSAFLSSWQPSRPPTLAAPGLSLHGQGRAFDFEIFDSKGRRIAGTDSKTVANVWDARGWTKRLADAVHSASGKFVGPLAAPREPWHYEYRRESHDR
jgi:hypothetical protein